MLVRLLTGNSSRDKIVFTVAPTDSNRVLTLQDFTEPCKATVDWGDGTADRITANTAISHTYADNTARQVTIRGELGGFWNSATRAAGTGMVTSLDEVSSESLVSLAETFRQCTGLRDLPEIITAPSLTKCDRSFYLCKSISSDLPYLWLSNAGASHTNCFTRCFLTQYGQYGTACPSRSYVDAVTAQTYYQKYGTSCPGASHVAAVAKKTYYQQYSTSCSSASYVAGTAKKTYYNQYGTNCSSASYVAGTAKKTYYQQYGTSCPRRSYVAAVAEQTMYDYYGAGNDCPYFSIESVGSSFYCPNCGSSIVSLKAHGCSKASTSTFSYFPNNEFICSKCGTDHGPVNLVGKIATCLHTTSAGKGCKVTYRAAQAAYYKCSTSGGKCSGSSCSYTYQAATSAYYKCSASSSSGVTKCSSSCNRTYQNATSAYYKCNASSSSGTSTCGSSCNRTYQAAQSAYYSCTQSAASGIGTCGSGCQRVFQAGQSAYYKCTRSNATCQTDNCEYPYANETDVTAAKNAGWA